MARKTKRVQCTHETVSNWVVRSGSNPLTANVSRWPFCDQIERWCGKKWWKIDLPTQIRTGCVRCSDFLYFQHYNGRYENTNDIDNGQATGHNATNEELCRNVICVEPFVRWIAFVWFTFQVWHFYVAINQPIACQCPVQSLSK